MTPTASSPTRRIATADGPRTPTTRAAGPTYAKSYNDQAASATIVLSAASQVPGGVGVLATVVNVAYVSVLNPSITPYDGPLLATVGPKGRPILIGRPVPSGPAGSFASPKPTPCPANVAPNKPAMGGIYEFPDQTAGGTPYVGQSSNVPNRLKQHQAAGRLLPGTEGTTPIAGGKTAREIAEYNRIQQLTGGQKARNSPTVSNKVDPIGPTRRPGLGLSEPQD